MNRGNKRKTKIRYDRVFGCLIVLIIVGFVIYNYIDRNLRNIYIRGNKYLSDQTIIELAKLENYPKMIKIDTLKVKKQLLNNKYINDVKITKKQTEIDIEIKEAKPIYYDSTNKKTVLSNGNEVEDIYIVPTLINYVPDILAKNLKEEMSKVEDEVLVKMSEIKYDPNIDSERFLITMADGNYVYININRFNLINNYLTIISNFKNQKGIIYLDSGSHFEVLKEEKEHKNEE